VSVTAFTRNPDQTAAEQLVPIARTDMIAVDLDAALAQPGEPLISDLPGALPPPVAIA
jgi:hypothetical protein